MFQHVRDYLRWRVESAALSLPAGVSISMTGNYENQVRAWKTLMVVVPLALLVILVILQLQFSSAAMSGLVFCCIFVNWAGAFVLIWLYGQPWFLDFDFLGSSMREIFQVHPVNLSVAVWVGFIALFGVSSDDGVVMGTYLTQSFAASRPSNTLQVRQAVLEAGRRRIRPCMMTMATTLLALLPVLSSKGRGSDLILPMAIPSVGGLAVEIITMLIVPVVYCWIKERELRRERKDQT